LATSLSWITKITKTEVKITMLTNRMWHSLKVSYVWAVFHTLLYECCMNIHYFMNCMLVALNLLPSSEIPSHTLKWLFYVHDSSPNCQCGRTLILKHVSYYFISTFRCPFPLTLTQRVNCSISVCVFLGQRLCFK